MIKRSILNSDRYSVNSNGVIIWNDYVRTHELKAVIGAEYLVAQAAKQIDKRIYQMYPQLLYQLRQSDAILAKMAMWKKEALSREGL